MMAVSIIHGGPAPNVSAPSVVDYLLFGMGKVRATVEEVPCATMRTKLYKVSCLALCRQTRERSEHADTHSTH